MNPVGIGLIGCGNISDAYLKAISGFPSLQVRGVADLRLEAAQAAAAKHGLMARTVDELLRDDRVEIIVNLTIPGAHVEVGLQAIAAGKHVHSEKPLGLNVADARRLIDAAQARNLRVGCAPDTFFGGGHQTCRQLVDQGAIGQPVGGSAFFLCPGHERWHPNPAFYYAPGGGPMLDMGPYYITALVNLIGPVARVAGMATRLRDTRLITSEPLKGQRIPVDVATHVAGTLEFVNGAVVSIATSFDVPRHRHTPIELYGTEATLQVPDPNRFGGPVELARAGADWVEQPLTHGYADGNFRGIGVADLAFALRTNRPHRASGELALHALEVMEAFQRSSDSGRHIDIQIPPGPAGGPRHRAARLSGPPQENVLKKALIVWGGWHGHEPRTLRRHRRRPCCAATASRCRWQTSTRAFVDPGLSALNLIVPIYTMSKIEKDECANLTAAVQGGVGLAGFHGGMCDAFRDSVDYQFMTGGQWVAHPGGVIDFRVNVTRPDDPVMAGLADFDYRSEQYYMHVDPANEVLATTTFGGQHAPWIEGVVMPVAWKRRHGQRPGVLQRPRPCVGRVPGGTDAYDVRTRHALGRAGRRRS